jgi:SAM-dependent methyltransferase
VPVIGGTMMVTRREVLDHVGGYDDGMRQRASEDMEISLRLWLFGYELWVVPEVDVPHLYRPASPYPVENVNVLYNQLRAGFLHLSTERLARFLEYWGRFGGFHKALAICADSDVYRRRAELLAQRLHDDRWFFEERLPTLSGLTDRPNGGQPSPEPDPPGATADAEPSVYDADYFDWQIRGARLSAEVVVPLVLELVGPRSVVDVGCGVGAWLAVFGEHGIADLLGVDGAFLDRWRLLIPTESFVAHDLTTPLRLGRTFDLAVCLEMAEHLPGEAAETLTATLTDLAPVVLFSAAPPGQGGVGHVNEQPPAYWQALFWRRGYVPVDVLRSQIWTDGRVEPWYSQNTLLYVRQDCLRFYPRLREARRQTDDDQLLRIHPRLAR